jgi:hypothetical protein
MVADGHAVIGSLDARLRCVALHAQHSIVTLSLFCRASSGRMSLPFPLRPLGLLGPLPLPLAFPLAFLLLCQLPLALLPLLPRLPLLLSPGEKPIRRSANIKFIYKYKNI